MYEAKTTGKRPVARTTGSATEEEIKAAIAGTLAVRSSRGDRNQPELTQTGTNKMPVGRPLGTSTGLPLFMAICYVFQQNEKATKAKKLTDEQISEWLRHEFPGRNTAYFDRVQETRNYYNRGKYTRSVPPRLKSHRYDSGGTEIDPSYTRQSRRKTK